MSNAALDTKPPSGLPVRMIRPNLDDLPQWPLPDGYYMRAMRADEGAVWEEAWRASEPYEQIQPGLFASQFGSDPAEIELRCFFLIAPDGGVAGTISGWQSDLPDGLHYGQIHWVALLPAHRGRGLVKPLMAHAMNFLATRHERCFLDTATRRLPAIKVYLDFGFVPDMTFKDAEQAWALVQSNLAHPALGGGGEAAPGNA